LSRIIDEASLAAAAAAAAAAATSTSASTDAYQNIAPRRPLTAQQVQEEERFWGHIVAASGSSAWLQPIQTANANASADADADAKICGASSGIGSTASKYVYTGNRGADTGAVGNMQGQGQGTGDGEESDLEELEQEIKRMHETKEYKGSPDMI